MGQLMTQHVHTGSLVQQNIRALSRRLDSQRLRNAAPADADVGEVRGKARLKLLPQLGRHGLRCACTGLVQQFTPGWRRILLCR